MQNELTHGLQKTVDYGLKNCRCRDFFAKILLVLIFLKCLLEHKENNIGLFHQCQRAKLRALGKFPHY